jgi:tetratricopeptide (TPR) repeat protein
MQFAIYLFEGLRVGGMRVFTDSETPYVRFHRSDSSVDSIQFPFQTLAYRSGDLDDLGLLYVGILESVGIKAAIIPMEDDFLAAFSLGIDEAAAGTIFNNRDNLLVIDDEVWIVLALSTFNEGFVNCWYRGMGAINTAIESGGFIDMIPMRDAWTIYPPAAISAGNVQFERPVEDEVRRAAETNIMRYIAAEFGPKIQAVNDAIRNFGATAARYNELGLLYVRSGMYGEARAQYQQAAAMGSASAMANLGNLAMMDRDFTTAEQWFRRALQIDPENRIANNGLAQIATERFD